jgi:hypothetical protein
MTVRNRYTREETIHAWQVVSQKPEEMAIASKPLPSAPAVVREFREAQKGGGSISVVEKWTIVRHTEMNLGELQDIPDPREGFNQHLRVFYRHRPGNPWLQRIVPSPDAVERCMDWASLRRNAREFMVILTEVKRAERRLNEAEIEELSGL